MTENYLNVLEVGKNVRNHLKILGMVQNVRNLFQHSKNSTRGLEFQKITLRF